MMCGLSHVVDMVVGLACRPVFPDRSTECALLSLTSWYEISPFGYTDWLCAAILLCPSCSDLLEHSRQLPCRPISRLSISQLLLLGDVPLCTCWAVLFIREPLLEFLALFVFSFLVSLFVAITCHYICCLRAYISSHFVSIISHISSHIA